MPWAWGMGRKGGFVTQREVKGVPVYTVSLTMESQLHPWLKKTVRPKSTHIQGPLPEKPEPMAGDLDKHVKVFSIIPSSCFRFHHLPRGLRFTPWHVNIYAHLLPGTDASMHTIIGTMKHKGTRRQCSPLPRYKCAGILTRIGPGVRQNGVNQGLCSSELAFYASSAESRKDTSRRPLHACII